MFVRATETSFEKYDVLIAGSGPAGATIARRLAALGKTSLILETGQEDYDGDIQDQFSALYASGHYGQDHWPQHWIRAFGGTSAVWAGWCAPLSQRNLTAWPIDADELALYYPEAAGILGRSVDFLTYAAPFMTGFVSRPFSVDEPLRVYDAYLEEFRQSTLIDVALTSTVAGLYANENRSSLTGFKVFDPQAGHQDITLRDGQQLVLAAGGMGNAQILLASQADDGVAVGNEKDQVGRYLMEHPHFYHCARLVVSADMAFETLPESFGPKRQAIVPDDDTFARQGGLDASFALDERDLNPEDNVEQYVVQALGGQARAYGVTIRSEMPADPLNRVVRAEGLDPAGLPRLRASCMVSGDAFRAADSYLREMGRTLAQEGKGRLRIDNEAIFREVAGGGHTLGTTRMGDDPNISVVDRNCRVHGYNNLSIAGSSVFTSGGYANPTLTIVALALRLADHLGETS